MTATGTALTALLSETPVLLRTSGTRHLVDVRLTLVHPRTGTATDEHVRAGGVVGAAEVADVVVLPGGADLSAEVERAALRWPGALVVAVHGAYECRLRFRRPGAGPRGMTLGLSRPARPGDWAVRASVAHACLVAGWPVAVAAAALRVRRVSLAQPGLAGRPSSAALAATASSVLPRPAEANRATASS